MMKLTGILVLAILAAFSQAAVLNSPEENEIEGLIFEEGDMVVSDSSRNVRNDTNFLWNLEDYENGMIPFYMESDLSPFAQSVILEGIETYENETCIKFKQESTPPSTHFIRFKNSTGCWSYVGEHSSFASGQSISIGTGCERIGIVLHEIAHTLGLYHEQSRTDRDDYIEVLVENIISGRESQFTTKNTNNYGIPYDYYSVLHYRASAFSKNGEDTLNSIGQIGTQYLLGQRKKFSFYNKKLINTAYCIDSWKETCGTVECNEGYVKADCTCECRPGTRGQNCETEDMSYIDYLLEVELGGFTIVETNSALAASPSDYSHYTYFRAPFCTKAQVTFNTFDMPCTSEYVRMVGAANAESNVGYCGNAIGPGTAVISEETTILLQTVFSSSSSTSGGWTADVEYRPANLICWFQIMLANIFG